MPDPAGHVLGGQRGVFPLFSKPCLAWFPPTRDLVRSIFACFRAGDASIEAESDSEPEHAGHDHAAHAGHDEEASLELSGKARRNIGLTDDAIRPIRLQTYRKTIPVPAAVVEQQGRTRVLVATPMTGAITHVHAVEGQAVQPGSLLFRIRLTHEDLVKAQTNFVKTLGELDIEENEIARLERVPGTFPGHEVLGDDPKLLVHDRRQLLESGAI